MRYRYYYLHEVDRLFKNAFLCLFHQIKSHRQRIRNEENDNDEYGIHIEQRLNAMMQEAIFKKGRDRRLEDELR